MNQCIDHSSIYSQRASWAPPGSQSLCYAQVRGYRKAKPSMHMALTPQKIERKSQVHLTSGDGKSYKGSCWKVGFCKGEIAKANENRCKCSPRKRKFPLLWIFFLILPKSEWLSSRKQLMMLAKMWECKSVQQLWMEISLEKSKLRNRSSVW